jgi:hypothetical protein
MINFFRTRLIAAVIVFALGCFCKNPNYPLSWPQTTGSNEMERQIEGFPLCQEKSLRRIWDYGIMTT